MDPCTAIGIALAQIGSCLFILGLALMAIEVYAK